MRAVRLTSVTIDGPPTSAEVAQHQAALLVAHHVLRLDVAMQQPFLVHRAQRATKLDADLGRLGRLERTVGVQFLLERAPLDDLHPETHPPIDPIGTVNGDDPGVADPCLQTPF